MHIVLIAFAIMAVTGYASMAGGKRGVFVGAARIVTATFVLAVLALAATYAAVIVHNNERQAALAPYKGMVSPEVLNNPNISVAGVRCAAAWKKTLTSEDDIFADYGPPYPCNMSVKDVEYAACKSYREERCSR
jgi:hypothetical protein